jgi:hypothetical protein
LKNVLVKVTTPPGVAVAKKELLVDRQQKDCGTTIREFSITFWPMHRVVSIYSNLTQISL